MTHAQKICLTMLVLFAPACRDRDEGRSATALLTELGGSGVSGTVRFTTVGDAVRVDAEVQGLAPGTYGFHVHEWGDCSGPDGKAAGDHFDPLNLPHGPPGTGTHPGDLGNLQADASGTARLRFDAPQITVDTGPMGVVGRSVIVHEGPDDLTSQPTGESGGRIACGIIRADVGATVPVVIPR